MKLLFAIAISLLLCQGGYGQSGAENREGDAEQIVKRMIDSRMFEGHDDKVIGKMGDAAAVAITKVIAGRDLRSSDISTVLLVINSAFADPLFVDTVSDREPRTTLFLLRCLDSATKDPSLKKQIADVGAHAKEQYVKSAARNR